MLSWSVSMESFESLGRENELREKIFWIFSKKPRFWVPSTEVDDLSDRDGKNAWWGKSWFSHPEEEARQRGGVFEEGLYF
jgi:hypothetical protein